MLPYMKWFPADWIKDTRILSSSQRGVWIDIINYLATVSDRGEKTNTIDEWSRAIGHPIAETIDGIDALERHKIANVSRSANGNVTVLSRRLVRDTNTLVSDRKRQRKHRSKVASPATVTPDVTEKSRCRIQNPESRIQNPLSQSGEGDECHRILTEQFPTLSWEDDLTARKCGPGMDFLALALECVKVGSNSVSGIDNPFAWWRTFIVKAAGLRTNEKKEAVRDDNANGPVSRRRL